MSPPNESRLLVLDVGLSATTPNTQAGEILEFTTDGTSHRTLIPKQALPDGLAIDRVNNRMIWTCMGVPGELDGAVYSANLDGTDIQTIVAPGLVNTPKQLTLDTSAGKVYFCDREGQRVWRCNLNGSSLEAIVSNGEPENPPDGMKWCVGVTVAPQLGKFYWTQKGLSKSARGRIFSANISTPAGQSVESRDDIQCIFDGLPEPIDLEFDEASGSLYWTDRGELPWGNSLNRARLDASGLPLPIAASSEKKHEVLARNFNETIGLKLDPGSDSIYITDLGGSIYRCNMEGNEKARLYSEDCRAFTGIAIL